MKASALTNYLMSMMMTVKTLPLFAKQKSSQTRLLQLTSVDQIKNTHCFGILEKISNNLYDPLHHEHLSESLFYQHSLQHV